MASQNQCLTSTNYARYFCRNSFLVPSPPLGQEKNFYASQKPLPEQPKSCHRKIARLPNRTRLSPALRRFLMRRQCRFDLKSAADWLTVSCLRTACERRKEGHRANSKDHGMRQVQLISPHDKFPTEPNPLWKNRADVLGICRSEQLTALRSCHSQFLCFVKERTPIEMDLTLFKDRAVS